MSKMTYARKMPKPVETSEATRKALDNARTEKERIAVRAAEASMVGGVKKEVKVKVKQNVGRSGGSKAVH
jgi:hypothetical protein